MHHLGSRATHSLAASQNQSRSDCSSCLRMIPREMIAQMHQEVWGEQNNRNAGINMFCCLSAMLSSMQAPPMLIAIEKFSRTDGAMHNQISQVWILKALVSYQPFASCLMSLCKVPVEAKARYNQAWYELWFQPLANSLIFMVAKTCSHCFFHHNNTKQSSTAVSARKLRQSTGSVLKSTGE